MNLNCFGGKKLKLQLTSGYYVRFNQISRLLQYIDKNSSKKNSRQEIMDAVGFSDRQLENLYSISTALGLVVPRIYKLTKLGTVISQKDPFFDNKETLWIIHYIISHNPKYVVWHRLVNKVIPENEIINTEISKKYFADLQKHYSPGSMRNNLNDEILSVLNAYTEQVFNKLEILSKTDESSYLVNANPEIPFLSFLYMILCYRESVAKGASSLEINLITGGPNSPGKVLNISAKKAEELLDKGHDYNLIRIEKFGDLDQIRFSGDLTKEILLNRIYGD